MNFDLIDYLLIEIKLSYKWKSDNLYVSAITNTNRILSTPADKIKYTKQSIDRTMTRTNNFLCSKPTLKIT